MDEEKQKDGLVEKAGNSLKEGSKAQAKKSIQKVFKKLIALLAPILLKLIVVVFIIVIVVTAISDFLDKFKGRTSKEAEDFAVYYEINSDEDEEGSLNRIIIDINNVSEDGAYILKYEFKDEDGNLYTEAEALKNIKRDLGEGNANLDIKQFSDSELKIIGVLMYNGLRIDKYNEEELKALAIFVKADIASQNFDLRSKDKIGETVDVDEIAENDYVYGTLQMHRTKAAEGYDSETKLEYIPYGDENTPGTFCYMDKQEDMNIMNKFSITDEGKAIFAKWSSTNISYVYRDENGKKLSNDEIAQKISEDNIFEDLNRTFITTTSFNYKQYIARYAVNYGLLSDLLTITQNPNFCLELAQLAFNGKIVINVKEELSITDSTKKATYTQTRLLYDYVTYEISGQKENSTSEWKIEKSGEGNPNNSDILKDDYGWNSGYKPIKTIGNSSGGTSTYQWTYKDTKYQLTYTSTLSNSYWSLYKEDVNIEYEDLPKMGGKNELIKLNHIKEEYEDYTINEDYTKQEKFVYTVETTSHSEGNICSYEISELDCWYLKYHKKYEAPVPTPSSVNDTTENKGDYPEEATEILNTNDESEINKVQEVKDYITQKKKDYIKNNSASKAESVINNLIIKEKVKTDEKETYSSKTMKYKFGEEIADTTEVQFKNIEYVNNQQVFNKDSQEMGFLYIYDKYVSQGIDLYLQNDSERRLFELLEDDNSTYQYSRVIRYLLYVYDGIDRDVTSLKIKIIDIEGMNKVKGSSIANYIQAWENGRLWAYETGQSTVFPTGYLTDDELFYIVYEDGSAGHNNIAYGITTFISSTTNIRDHNPDWGDGYYNWKKEFEEEGVLVEDLYEGAYVDKAISDYVFYNKILKAFINEVNDYLETNLPEYKFSKTQKDALVNIAYKYGNILGFSDAYKNALNEDGTIDAEKLREWDRFNYSGTVNDRKYANWLLFTEGKYIDRAGNILPIGSGSIVEAAYEVADYFLNSGVDVHYAGNSVKDATKNGRSCRNGNIQKSWEEPIKYPDKVGVVCATFVSFAIWKAGLIDEATINQYSYHAVGGVQKLLEESEYKDDWEIIGTWDELQEGDIVIIDGHVFIYMEGDKAFDQTYCILNANYEQVGYDNRGTLKDASRWRGSFIVGFRYIG